jgi:pimeloyl-ACP methyl ester carboxylesterase
MESRVKAGSVVALIDPRGMGETTPLPPGTGGYGRGPFGPDEREAFLGLHLARPLLGQRVFDVLQVLDKLDLGQGFDAVGVGMGAAVILHAAALDERIRSIEVRQGLVSWLALTSSPQSKGQLASVVPGVLADYDLPDLASLIAPRKLVIYQPMDPVGLPLSQEQADREYVRARSVYSAEGVPTRLEIRTR